MTTYVGRIGDMIPIGCVSSAPVTTEGRVVVGGGAGTLAPRRVRVYGAGARDWSVQVGVQDFAESNALESLVYTQARFGGSYRVIPCEAVEHNMMTPAATEGMVGWSNMVPGWRASYPDLDPTTSAVIPVTIPFIIGGSSTLTIGSRPSTLGKITAGQTSNGPLVPAVRKGDVYARAYVSGSGTLRLRVYDGTGASTATSQAFTGTAGVLQRVAIPAVTIGVTAVSMRIEVVATTQVYAAWPQVAHRDVPYTTGKGCDAAYISPPSRDVIGAWGTGLQSTAYSILEVGV